MSSDSGFSYTILESLCIIALGNMVMVQSGCHFGSSRSYDRRSGGQGSRDVRAFVLIVVVVIVLRNDKEWLVWLLSIVGFSGRSITAVTVNIRTRLKGGMSNGLLFELGLT